MAGEPDGSYRWGGAAKLGLIGRNGLALKPALSQTRVVASDMVNDGFHQARFI